jgi:hypothetical protein
LSTIHHEPYHELDSYTAPIVRHDYFLLLEPEKSQEIHLFQQSGSFFDSIIALSAADHLLRYFISLVRQISMADTKVANR